MLLIIIYMFHIMIFRFIMRIKKILNIFISKFSFINLINNYLIDKK